MCSDARNVTTVWVGSGSAILCAGPPFKMAYASEYVSCEVCEEHGAPGRSGARASLVYRLRAAVTDPSPQHQIGVKNLVDTSNERRRTLDA